MVTLYPIKEECIKSLKEYYHLNQYIITEDFLTV